MPDDDVPVLIAGGSLVGMSMAMLLGGHGIASLVVERHRGAAIHPRAAFLLQRTMEILRAAGIEGEVRDGSHAQFEPDGGIMSAETLAGREIAYHLPNVNAGVRDMSRASGSSSPRSGSSRCSGRGRRRSARTSASAPSLSSSPRTPKA